MGVKTQVFASKSERRNFYKLSRQWGEEYQLYHNLPFLNVFDPTNLFDRSSFPPKPTTITDFEFNRLKRTSIDYTLCDINDHAILSIEFDGMNEGFNLGTRYRAGRQPDPWREQITELKLRVAHGSFFPYFVLASKHFEDLTPEIKLTLVDGIIGEVLAKRAATEKFAAGFNPTAIGFSAEDFEELDPFSKDCMIQDWVIGVEVEADMKHNPIHRLRAELDIRAGHPSCSQHFLEYPKVPSELSLKERARRIEKAILMGASCTIALREGSIERTVWLPNFKTPMFSGLGLLEELAHLLALSELLGRQKS
jgi:hypothetical protein